jgi:hypothetical protein
MQQRDYFERLIQQIAEAVARVLGFAREGRADEAEQELDRAWSSAVNLRRRDVDRLDDSTLRLLLGPKARLAASLLEAEASIADARGDAVRADGIRRRAARLGSDDGR